MMTKSLAVCSVSQCRAPPNNPEPPTSSGTVDAPLIVWPRGLRARAYVAAAIDVYGIVRRTAPSDLLRTIRWPGSRLSSASTSRLFEPSNTIAFTSPKFCAGALAAEGVSGAGGAGAGVPRAMVVGAALELVVPAAPRPVGLAAADGDELAGADFGSAAGVVAVGVF